MDLAKLLTSPWVWGGIGLLVYQRTRNTSSIDPNAKPPATPTTGAACGYPASGLPPAPAKTVAELQNRVWRAILSYNGKVNDTANGMGFVPDTIGKTYAKYLAEFLAESAIKNNVPLDLLVALARRESSFIPTVTTGRYEAIGWTDEAIKKAVQNQWAIGPLQVKPVVFTEVGLASPSRWPGDPIPWRHPARLRDAVEAGARYLKKQRDRFGSWCAALHAYNVGPGAYAKGSRAERYVSQIIAWANNYTELRT
ncbi:lytic transglycosylase domain-containing protein [Meiothermus hypogaeus]|uniref:Transglycosylase SLT domain protein n=1 Tax=Meiothermus hypogaeus TaxID=884155 RepID=A0ABX9MK64_9DEIN|nr:lytic transglycosylase domain-containing protein [Meiothermus hypogaeus]RIH76667.1 Transglycosylase SLT domain protein [Meiothermus hypogaeus]